MHSGNNTTVKKSPALKGGSSFWGEESLEMLHEWQQSTCLYYVNQILDSKDPYSLSRQVESYHKMKILHESNYKGERKSCWTSLAIKIKKKFFKGKAFKEVVKFSWRGEKAICFKNQLYTMKAFIICRNRDKNKNICEGKKIMRGILWRKDVTQEGKESTRTE